MTWRVRLAAAALAAGAALMVQPASAASLDHMRLASVDASLLTENTADVPGKVVVAEIDLSDQTMTVTVNGEVAHTFTVSTGRGSYRTPTGSWKAAWLSPKHRSRKYNNAPMPWSVFFYQGYAVHGTTDLKRLGRPASHGCVRLHPDNAKLFFSLVKKNGLDNTTVTIVQ